MFWPLDKRRDPVTKTKLAIAAVVVLFVNGCGRQDTSQQQHSDQAAQNNQTPISSPSEQGAQQSIKGFSIKVVSVKRAKEWEDPRFKNADFGPGAGPRIESQKVGFEFAIVTVDVKRLDDKARFDLKEMWILDSSGKKYKSPVLFQDELGETAEETREFVFSVPVKSELKRIQLAADTFLELP
jgi:hypothetical protein